jgi:hypothetical protein
MVFLVVTSQVVISMADWVSNDLHNGQQINSAQTLHTAADSAAQQAIQSVRYLFLPASTPTTPEQQCLDGGTASTWTPATPASAVSGPTVNVWCSTTLSESADWARVVTIYVCPGSGTTYSACEASTPPLLTVQVTFDDATTDGISECDAKSNLTCGIGMVINSWVLEN